MLNFFVPTAKNNYRAYLLQLPVLLLFIMIIGSFNFLVKVDVKAADSDTAINSANLLAAHNVEREQEGLHDLKINGDLNVSAQNKAQKMLESNCWSHYCPDGESPWDFFKEAGYDFVLAGENLAEGFYNVDTLMNAWMNSKTHKDNIMNGDYQEVGFGIVTGNYQGMPSNTIVVVHFGTQPSQILKDVSKVLVISKPLDNTGVTKDSIDIEGVVHGLDKVNIILNAATKGEAKIKGGIFTYNLEGLKEGANYIYAQSALDYGLSKDSNIVKVTYNQPEEDEVVLTQVSGTSENLTSSPEMKNIINIAFIIGLGILFLIDFLVLARTHIIGEEKSFGHYHFGLLFILVIIVLAGGFSGSLTQALSI